MNSRERVLTALQHCEPDRVPIDLGGMRSTGVHAIAYNRLKAHLGLDGQPARVFDIAQQLAEPEEAIRRRFHVDVIALHRLEVDYGLRNPPDPEISSEVNGPAWQPWTLPDGSPALISSEFQPVRQADGGWAVFDKDGERIAYMPQGGYYFFQTHHPLATATTPEEIEAYALSQRGQSIWRLISDEELDFLRRQARHLYKHTDYAIIGGFGGNILEWGQSLRGWDQFLVDLIDHRGLAEYLMDRMTEVHLTNLSRYLDAVGEYIQIIQMGDDLGTQHGPQMSPQMYRELIKPRHQRIYQAAKARGVYVFLHSCGSIYKLIPDLIEAGVDILNPVQTSAAEMEPARLKAEFGNHVTFWGGGCDTQRVLPNCTPDEVRADVRQRLEIFAPGGGYVFNQVHNIQPDVPPENVVAMFDTAYTRGAGVECG